MSQALLSHSSPNLPGWGAPLAHPLAAPQVTAREALALADALTASHGEQRAELERLRALERRLIAAEREANREQRRAWQVAIETGEVGDELHAERCEERWQDIKSYLEP